MGILLLRKSRLTKGLCWHNFTWQGRWPYSAPEGCRAPICTVKFWILTYKCIEFISNIWNSLWICATILCNLSIFFDAFNFKGVTLPLFTYHPCHDCLESILLPLKHAKCRGFDQGPCLFLVDVIHTWTRSKNWSLVSYYLLKNLTWKYICIWKITSGIILRISYLNHYTYILIK